MCLTTTMITPVIADHDITVYKVVQEDNIGALRAPYRSRFVYQKNVEVHSTLSDPYPNEYDDNMLVDEGLHSFETFRDAGVECVYWRDCGHYHVHKAIIPAGAKYYRGKFGRYVSYASESLILKERVI